MAPQAPSGVLGHAAAPTSIQQAPAAGQRPPEGEQPGVAWRSVAGSAISQQLLQPALSQQQPQVPSTITGVVSYSAMAPAGKALLRRPQG